MISKLTEENLSLAWLVKITAIVNEDYVRLVKTKKLLIPTITIFIMVPIMKRKT